MEKGTKKKVAFLTSNPPSVRRVKEAPLVVGKIEKESRHYWLAVSVLAQLRHDILENNMSFLDDPDWGYHIIVPLGNSVRYSCFCSGFNKYVDVVKLTLKGTECKGTRERRFATTKGVVAFLQKRLKNGQ